MILADERAIDGAIKSGEAVSPILIYGEEEYLKQQAARRLTVNPHDAFASFNNLRLDFRGIDAAALFDAVLTLPLMSREKTVLVYDVEPKEIGAEFFKELEKLFKAAQGGQCRLVLLEKSGAVDDKKDDKSKKLVKLVDRYGSVFRFKERTEAALQKMVKAEASRLGCVLAPGAARLLVSRVGKDTAALRCETEKLSAYRNYQAEITEDDVLALTVEKPEDNIYGLSRAVLRGDYDGAMRILGGLLALRYPAESVLGTLSGFYVDLYRARAAAQAGYQAAQAAEDFGYGRRAFVFDGAMRDQRKLTEEYLLYALDVLSEADRKVKSTQSDVRTVLEQTLTALFLRGGRAEAVT